MPDDQPSALSYLQQQITPVMPMASSNPQDNAGGDNQQATVSLPSAQPIQVPPESQRMMADAEKAYKDTLDAQARRARAEQIGQIGEKLYTGIAAIGLGAAGRAGGYAGMDLLQKAHQDAQQAHQAGYANEQQHLQSLKALIDIHNKGMLGGMAQSVKLAQNATKERIAEQTEAAKNLRAQHANQLKAALEILKNNRGEKALGIKQQLANETVTNDITKSALAGMGLTQKANELASLDQYRKSLIDTRTKIANMESEDKKLGRSSLDNRALLEAKTRMKIAAAQYIGKAQQFNAGLEKDLSQKDELGHYKYADENGDPLNVDDIKLAVPDDPQKLVDQWGEAALPEQREQGAQPIATPTSIGAMPTSAVPNLPTMDTIPPGPALRGLISQQQPASAKPKLVAPPKAERVSLEQANSTTGLTPKQKAINAASYFYQQPPEWQKKNLQSFINHYGHSPATYRDGTDE